jgi:HK97 family phage portal protein
MWPVTTKEDSARGVFISYYAYAPDPTNRQIIEPVPVEDIVHFRLGLDPNDRRLGCSPLKHLFREVFGDDEAAKWTESLLKNYAVPGLIVTIPREESRLFTEEMALALKAKIEAAFSNDNRGHVNVLKGGATMEQFGFSPEQLSLTSIRRHFEERISAATRVPLAIAGLGGTSQITHSNLRELREQYTETALIPQYTFDAATINLQLLPDFTRERRVFARYDISKMRALQEDTQRMWSRLDNAVKTGWLRKSEARRAAGYPPDEDEFDVSVPVPTPESLPGDAVSSPVANGPMPDARRNGSANRIFNPSLNSAPSDLERRALQHTPTVTPENLPDVLDALVQQVIPSLERDVQGYLSEQQKRVLAGLEAHPYVPSGNGVAR